MKEGCSKFREELSESHNNNLEGTIGNIKISWLYGTFNSREVIKVANIM